jgi:hypothetical protein
MPGVAGLLLTPDACNNRRVHAIGRTARAAIARHAVSEGMQKYAARSL